MEDFKNADGSIEAGVVLAAGGLLVVVVVALVEAAVAFAAWL